MSSAQGPETRALKRLMQCDMLESLKCALKSVNSSMHLHFVFIPESTVPAKLVTITLAKSSEKAGTGNCGKPCPLTKSLCPEN